MVNTVKNMTLSLLIAGIILLVGCSGASSVSNQPPVNIPVQPPSQTPVQQSVGSSQVTSTGASPAVTQPLNKVEVIYFHLTQRCVTCLCFESRIKWVMDKYFKDAINSGKLTFSILNAQETKNAAIVKKYKAVGSQLFVNTIVNGVDHIKDIQAIWDWNCNNDAAGFGEKVRSVIDQNLEGKY